MNGDLDATARVVATAGPDGTTRLPVLRSQSPLVLRRTGRAGAVAEVHLVGGAAGPLGGDQLLLEVEVYSGASLVLRTAAASVALPGQDGRWSRSRVLARVERDAALTWLPEPLVAAHGCRHRMTAEVDVAGGGRLCWREEVVWGRHGEDGGDVVSALSVTYDEGPLLAHELALGPGAPGWDGPAVLHDGRGAGSMLVAGPGHEDYPASAGDRCAVLPLGGPGVLVSVVAPDALTLRRQLSPFPASSAAPGEP